MLHSLLFLSTPPAPPDMTKPKFLEHISATEMRISLTRASEKHGEIKHYYLVVVPEEEAARKNPDDFDIEQVRLGQASVDTENSLTVGHNLTKDILPKSSFIIL